MSPDAVDVDVARLSELPADALRLLWSHHVRTVPPRVSPGLLALALGHHLQTRRWGGLDASALRQLVRSAETGLPLRPSAMPGTRLVRAWQGKTHVVTIDEQGRILWNDKVWRSLSEVARTITGTRWSGPAFFGLRPRSSAARKAAICS
jgi:Protein of unknown function (DUF2924)